MRVLKFGGSSVGSPESIAKVIEIVTKKIDEIGQCAVVLSAMKGVTDLLIGGGKLAERGDEGFRQVVKDLEDKHIQTIRELLPVASQTSILSATKVQLNELESLYESVSNLGELSLRSLDRIVSFGELMISKIVAAKFETLGIETLWKDSRELIRTDSNFGAAAVDFALTNEQIKQAFDSVKAPIVVLPGFIGSDVNGFTTTLGRGGGDYSAAIFAAALDSDALEIWTDVSGVMTADPRMVRNVGKIPHITYNEAMELSHFGAKVIYPPTLQPVRQKGLPVYIKNTFQPDDEGTTISAQAKSDNDIIRGITSIDGIAILSLEGSGMVGIPGFSKRLFEVLSQNKINVVLITQASSEHSICVGIEGKFTDLAKHAIDQEFESEILAGRVDPLRVETGVSIVAVVGDRMRYHTGVSGKMFAALGSQGVNIRAIAQGSSERNISAVVASRDVRKAVNVLHEAFFSDGNRQINLFVAGIGSVGSAFLEQLRLQKEHLLTEAKLDVRVIGLANSRQRVFSDNGVDLNNWRDGMAAREEALSQMDHAQSFVAEVVSRNLRNSIFIDMTASADVTSNYGELLRNSVAVVACNKIAASSEYQKYRELKDLAREYNTSFFFETNVGAGLPVMSTLKDLISSGDRVNRIEGVLSGSLNYIFSSYDASAPFASIVRAAQAAGYTEPDPRLDLSGTDVARKILILARESGSEVELSDVERAGFLPESCLTGSVDDFFAELENNEEYFQKLFCSARENGKTVRFVASFDAGMLRAGPQSIDLSHDFAGLSGTDNAIAFYTDRYKDRPLVVKGAGAGPEVTASGVFADMMRVAG